MNRRLGESENRGKVKKLVYVVAPIRRFTDSPIQPFPDSPILRFNLYDYRKSTCQN